MSNHFLLILPQIRDKIYAHLLSAKVGSQVTVLCLLLDTLKISADSIDPSNGKTLSLIFFEPHFTSCLEPSVLHKWPNSPVFKCQNQLTSGINHEYINTQAIAGVSSLQSNVTCFFQIIWMFLKYYSFKSKRILSSMIWIY